MRTNAEIIDYIKQLMYKQKISGNQLANKTGIAKSTISRYLNQTNKFPINRSNKFAKALHTTPEDLIGVIPTYATNNLKNTHDYPYLDAGVACGAPALVDSYTKNDLERIQLSDAVMGKYAGDKDILVIHANGESMNRVFPNGALLAVKKTDNLSNGDIVIFSVSNEDFSCNRYYKNDKAKVILFQPDSDDPSFEPYVCRYEDAKNITIFGRVVVYTVVL